MCIYTGPRVTDAARRQNIRSHALYNFVIQSHASGDHSCEHWLEHMHMFENSDLGNVSFWWSLALLVAVNTLRSLVGKANHEQPDKHAP